MSWLLFILVAVVNQGKGLEFLINILVFCAALCRMLSLCCTAHLSVLTALFQRLLDCGFFYEEDKGSSLYVETPLPTILLAYIKFWGKLDAKKYWNSYGLFCWGLHVRVKVLSCTSMHLSVVCLTWKLPADKTLRHLWLLSWWALSATSCIQHQEEREKVCSWASCLEPVRTLPGVSGCLSSLAVLNRK